MQAVVFHIGTERFAIDTESVTEVIPCVPARPVPAAPKALTGVIEYRGTVVPVLDLCRLFDKGDCPVRLSSRILVCSLGTSSSEGAGPPLLGILAENVTRVASIDPDAPGSHPGPATEGFGGLGRILRDQGGLLQLVTVADLIPPAVLAAVVRDAGSPTA